MCTCVHDHMYRCTWSYVQVYMIICTGVHDHMYRCTWSYGVVLQSVLTSYWTWWASWRVPRWPLSTRCHTALTSRGLLPPSRRSVYSVTVMCRICSLTCVHAWCIRMQEHKSQSRKSNTVIPAFNDPPNSNHLLYRDTCFFFHFHQKSRLDQWPPAEHVVWPC